ncbi:hypothetical protein [Streptomyces sp. NRRL S-495]|uniref:hypothetical protein n=1 Tax=Streptomyces sp. NRRL S-495 TaxID=1609133 RepID=UPI0005F901DB|nr:hypothetical protein [Streptomyces sp. NRRL S-495]KJY27416.1 hypothetical protein VR45_34935 [Streptomyces sp. NRRL S-495]
MDRTVTGGTSPDQSREALAAIAAQGQAAAAAAGQAATQLAEASRQLTALSDEIARQLGQTGGVL